MIAHYQQTQVQCIYIYVCVYIKCHVSFHNIPAEAEKGKVISRLYNYTHRFPST